MLIIIIIAVLSIDWSSNIKLAYFLSAWISFKFIYRLVEC